MCCSYAPAIADYGGMEIPLEGAREKLALLIAAFAIAAIIIFQASEVWLADYRIHSKNIELMERGTTLLPGDGRGWDLLGHYYQWDFIHSDLPRALTDYQHAVHDNPLSADYWMDVASASETKGDVTGARQAFERAQAVYPASGEVDFYYGNFLLRQQENPGAYDELRRAVIADPKLLPLVISRVWRSSEDVNLLLDRVLPANIDAYLQALDFFGATHQTDAALVVWERIRQMGTVVPLTETFPLLDELIRDDRDDRADDARRVWREALATAGLPSTEPARGSRFGMAILRRSLRMEGSAGAGIRLRAPRSTSIFSLGQTGRGR